MAVKWILNVLIVLSVSALAIIGYIAAVKAERLMIENERLKRMNAGQKKAIETLQEELWFMEDLRKEGS